MKRSRPSRLSHQALEGPAATVAPPAGATVGGAADRHAGLLLAALALGLFLATQYARFLTLAFVNDDFCFLDLTRTASFASLWKRHDLIFGWYRPWSRELHYWWLQHLFGTRELPFHVASFALWLGLMSLYFTWVRRLAGSAAASVATAGLASLALWGTPLSWVAGVQDLWVLFFTLVFLHLLARGRRIASAMALALALLSKESGAILPGLAVAYLVLVERRSARETAVRTAPFWLIALAWAVIHPLLGARFFGPLRTSLETTQRLSTTGTMVRTVLAQVNLDSWPNPGDYASQALAQGALGAAILAGFVWLTAVRSASGQVRPRPTGVMVLGFVWALAGWSILLMPSIGWHAYYGVMGSLGAWLLLGTWLSARPRAAVLVVALLALLRSTQAHTLSWDWGSEWYQRRAGSILGAIRTELLRQHPSFPPSSRVFFVHIPNNIGLLAGDGPSLRVWYRDTTLRGLYYSQYTPRTDGHENRDFFFRFDSAAGMIEVFRGPEDVESARRLNPSWEDNHEDLAGLFLRAWDLPAAATEYGKLGSLPWGTHGLIYAGACHQLMGDTARAESCYALVAGRMGYPVSAVRDSTGWLAAQIMRQVRSPAALAQPPAR